MERGKTDREAQVAFLAGIFGAEASRNEALSTDEMRRGLEGLDEAAERLHNVDPELAQGNLFEYVEVARFNTAAAEAGSDLRAHVTADCDPHAAADIRIERSDEVLREVQAKSYGDAADAARVLADDAYRGMDKLVPADTYEQVRGRWSGGEGDGSLLGELRYGDVSSGGTTRAEAWLAATDPDALAHALLSREIFEEVLATAGAAGASGSLVAAITSLIAKGSELAAADLAAAAEHAVKAGVRGAAVGGAAAGVRNLAAANDLAVPAALSVSLSSGAVGLGMILIDHASGRIGAREALVSSGKVAFRALLSGQGALLGASLGVVGAPLAGSVMGMWAASVLYDTAAATIRRKSAEERALRELEVAHHVAARELAGFRERFEVQLRPLVSERSAQLDGALRGLEKAATPGERLRALARLGALTGARLRFASQAEFDLFMSSRSSTLEI